MDINQLSSQIIRAAIEVHKHLVPDCLNPPMKNACVMS